MANAEYPDLPFRPPAAFGAGRPWANTPRVIVIHYTAGAERNTSAEDGAAYDARRTDGTSCHYFCDSDSVVQCVYTWDRANSALWNGNRIGVQYELCGTQQTRAQWLDPASDATLRNAARQVARDAAKYGIPIRKLTPAQVAAGEKGICGHADITKAFPSDGGDHMDPGAEFPWDAFLNYVKGGEDDMLDDERKALFAIRDMLGWVDGRVEGLAGLQKPSAGPTKGADLPAVQTIRALAGDLKGLGDTVSNLRAELTALAATVAKLSQPVVNVDAAALAGLPKPPTAAEIATELAKRIGNG